jgi:hypothetical protein
VNDDYEFDAMIVDSTMRYSNVRVVHASRYRELAREVGQLRALLKVDRALGTDPLQPPFQRRD